MDGEAFVVIAGSPGSDEVWHVARDFQGSMLALMNSSGAVVERYRYTVFGAVRVEDGTGSPLAESAYLDRFFLGRPLDPLTGFYDLRYRWYDPATGSFLSPDPLGPVDGWNLYQYGFGTPGTWLDPLGLQVGGDPIFVPQIPIFVTEEFGEVGALPLGDGCWAVYQPENACDEEVCGNEMCAAWKQGGNEGAFWHAGSEEIHCGDDLAQALDEIFQTLTAQERQGIAGATVLSMALGFVPIIGDALDLAAALTGTDLITGESLGTTERLLAAAAMLPFVPGVSRYMDDIAGATRGVTHTPDQRALKELVDEVTIGGRRPLPRADAETILDWADEVGYPGARATSGDLASPSNWKANPVPHIHLPGAGRRGHIPVETGVRPRH